MVLINLKTEKIIFWRDNLFIEIQLKAGVTEILALIIFFKS